MRPTHLSSIAATLGTCLQAVGEGWVSSSTTNIVVTGRGHDMRSPHGAEVLKKVDSGKRIDIALQHSTGRLVPILYTHMVKCQKGMKHFLREWAVKIARERQNQRL